MNVYLVRIYFAVLLSAGVAWGFSPILAWLALMLILGGAMYLTWDARSSVSAEQRWGMADALTLTRLATIGALPTMVGWIVGFIAHRILPH